MDRIQFFFDESGKSDLTSSEKSGQTHLVVAGLLVPWESAFWGEVSVAWERAAAILDRAPTEVELHGWEMYGGKGSWSNAPNALPVLEDIFSALKRHTIPIYWVGLPVKALSVVSTKPWEKVLVQCLDLLHKQFTALSLPEPVEVYGDANNWVSDGSAITMESWGAFADKQAGFLSSSEVHGIQIADVVAHTLYRSNKRDLSNTDKKAVQFRSVIDGQFHVLS